MEGLKIPKIEQHGLCMVFKMNDHSGLGMSRVAIDKPKGFSQENKKCLRKGHSVEMMDLHW